MKRTFFLLIICVVLISLTFSCSTVVTDNKFEVTGIVKSLNTGDTISICFTDGRHFYLKEMPNCQVNQGEEVKMFCHRLSIAYSQRVVVDSFAIIKPALKTRQ
jgi:hypothetical protein